MATEVNPGQKEEDPGSSRRFIVHDGNPVEIPPELAEVDQRVRKTETDCQERTRAYSERVRILTTQFDQLSIPPDYR